MKTDSHLTAVHSSDLICESIQASVSDKLDSSQPPSHDEAEHIAHCSECRSFVDFIGNDDLLAIASAPLSASSDLSETIMQRLHSSDLDSAPAPTHWRKIITIGSLAAAAAVIISLNINQNPPTAENLVDTTQAPTSIAILDEDLLKENLQTQYQAISSVAGEQWTNVSTSIISAKNYLSEKTESLSERILFQNKDKSQSDIRQINSTKV